MFSRSLRNVSLLMIFSLITSLRSTMALFSLPSFPPTFFFNYTTYMLPQPTAPISLHLTYIFRLNNDLDFLLYILLLKVIIAVYEGSNLLSEFYNFFLHLIKLWYLFNFTYKLYYNYASFFKSQTCLKDVFNLNITSQKQVHWWILLNLRK